MADGSTFLHLTHDPAVEDRAQAEYRRSPGVDGSPRWPGAVVPTVARLATLAALLPDWPAAGTACFSDEETYLSWAARMTMEGPGSEQDLARLSALLSHEGAPARVLDPFAGCASLLAPLARLIRAVAAERNPTAIHLARHVTAAVRSSAARLPFADAVVNAVVTDPPYYDLVPYTSVGRDLACEFGLPDTPDADETFETTAFELMLEEAFRESARVVAPGGRVVMLNTPKRLDFLRPLARSGLAIAHAAMINVKEPLSATAKTGRWWGSRVLLLDCRRPGDARPGDGGPAEATATAGHRIGWDRTLTACVEALPAAATGDLAEFVQATRSELIREAVRGAFGGPAPDPCAAFAVAWCAQFGVPETSRDEATVIADACGLSLDTPVTAGILSLDGDVARLARPCDWAVARPAPGVSVPPDDTGALAAALLAAEDTARALGTTDFWRFPGAGEGGLS